MESKRMSHKELKNKVEKYFALLHPDYKSLSSEERWNIYDEKEFIIENIDAIHEAFEDFSNSDSPRYMKNASEQEKMQHSLWHVKVEKYFALLHPDYKSLSSEEQWDLYDDKHFIIENTDAIHEAFENFSNPDSPRYMKNASEQEKMQHSLWHVKVEKYFALLHPDYKSLSSEERWDLYDDKHFIIENTDAIHETFENFSNSDSPRYMKNASEQEKMQHSMWHVKVEKYFALLHPDYKSLSPEEQLDLYDDKNFIIENTDAIHEAFEDFSNSDSPRYMKNASEQEKIKAVIAEIKLKSHENTVLSPQEVVKNALSSGIDKESTEEARKVETSITYENEKKGDIRND